VVHDSGPPRNGQSASQFDLPVDEVTCQQFVELITDYFEGALAGRTLSRVEEHLVMCDWCITYAEQMKATIMALQKLRRPTSPDPPIAALAALRAKKGAGQ
jgi:predicted anti-sigma-YlaC factor YlaD